MNPPPFRVRLLGSRPVIVASGLSTVLLGLIATQVTGTWPLATIALGVAIAAGNAEPKVRAYEAWQRDWDALGGSPGRRKRRGPTWPVFSGIALAAVFLSCPHDAQAGMLAIAAMLAPLLGVVWIIRRLSRRRRARKADVIQAVTVCARSNRFPVPAIAQMYGALPAHPGAEPVMTARAPATAGCPFRRPAGDFSWAGGRRPVLAKRTLPSSAPRARTPRNRGRISDFLTIPTLCCVAKWPPAGVHVVVVFNRNVAVHTYLPLAFLTEQQGEREGPGGSMSRGG